MKLRIAKKVLCSISKSRRKRLNELYPPFEKDGRTIYPSLHKNPLIAKARQRVINYCKKGNQI